MTRHKQLRRQARGIYREAILEAAETVFSRKGFTGSRMSDVAEEAGVATGTLYNYFDNKQDVFGSLIELRSQSFLADLARVEAAGPTAIERLRALIEASFAWIERHRGVLAVFLELGVTSAVEAQQLCGESHQDIHRRSRDIFERTMADAIAAGDISSQYQPAELTAYLRGAMHGAIELWLQGDGAEPLSEHADRLLSLFLHGAGS
jgi:AcrR family transcriptional regulator